MRPATHRHVGQADARRRDPHAQLAHAGPGARDIPVREGHGGRARTDHLPDTPGQGAQRAARRCSAQAISRVTSAGDRRFRYHPIHASGETGAMPRLRWMAFSTFFATRSGP